MLSVESCMLVQQPSYCSLMGTAATLNGVCRYFICDKKLAALGWTEKTAWKDGLRRTVDWYLAQGFASYWESGDVENVSPGVASCMPTAQPACSAAAT